MTDLTGANLIAGQVRPGSGEAFTAFDPARGEELDPVFRAATEEDVGEACEAAWTAFLTYGWWSAEKRAGLLDAIAAELEAIKETLVPRVMAESALPQPRVEGELGRTCGQLRLFATEVRSGRPLGKRVDEALPDRQPMPRVELRLRNIPIGPVAVFGASNFPLAFSVAGGDTASALAAGCPVVVKGHPAHPGTCELVGRAIDRAISKTGAPTGCFSLIQGGAEIGGTLVRHPRIKAVGFTGSRGGGLAISRMAAERPEPIPVFAEMSSINPVLIFPGAMAARPKSIGEGLAGSITMGAGQFCTNPGLVFAMGEDADVAAFKAALSEAISKAPPAAMLTRGIAEAYEKGLAKLDSSGSAKLLAEGEKAEKRCRAAVFETSLDAFAKDHDLHAENFGASSVIVRVKGGAAELSPVIEAMEGQLTATLQIEKSDIADAQAVLPVLERRVGRILVNGFPTGVEVAHAMVHGGPFPATSDARTTSVGTLAINRFLRPVCYQNFPAALLPEDLQD